MEATEDVRAISPLFWFSLGRHGIGLHFEEKPGSLCEALILRRIGSRGKAWEVSLDGMPRERFSTIEEAVQAVDYEVERMGRAAYASALVSASWRRRLAPPEMAQPFTSRRPPVVFLGDVLRLTAWQRIVGRGLG
jgi:hypothetical protein